MSHVEAWEGWGETGVRKVFETYCDGCPPVIKGTEL